MTGLLDAAGVAEVLGIKEELVKRRTKAESWPCVRFGSKTIRYRAEHVEAIIAMHESKTEGSTGMTGQTTRSRRRSA